MLVKLSVFGKWFDLHIQFFDGNFFIFPGKSPLFAVDFLGFSMCVYVSEYGVYFNIVV